MKVCGQCFCVRGVDFSTIFLMDLGTVPTVLLLFFHFIYNKSGSISSTLYVLRIFIFYDLRQEAIVRFVDIDGMVDQHHLHFLFII